MNKFVAILLFVLITNVLTNDTKLCLSFSPPATKAKCNAIHNQTGWSDKTKFRCCYIKVTLKNGSAEESCFPLQFTEEAINKKVKEAKDEGAKMTLECSSSYLATFVLFALAFLF